MKSVIVEIKDGFAAVLSNDGCIVKIKNNNYKIGQVIVMKSHTTKRRNKLLTWAATAATFVIISGVSLWSFVTPYSYVSLDVNPSIEFSLNRFDRVLSVKAVNDDGQEIINEMQLDEVNYKKIEDAIKVTVDQISSDGYFDSTTVGGIMIATSGKDMEKSEELAQELAEIVEAENVENGDTVEVEVTSVGLERVQRARELNVTPGKLNLVEKLQASAVDPDSIVIEDWLNRPVKDIMKATKENKTAKKLANKSNSTITEEEVTEKTEESIDINESVDVDANSKEKANKKSVEKSPVKQEKNINRTNNNNNN